MTINNTIGSASIPAEDNSRNKSVSTEQWVTDTCQVLSTNEWPHDRPLCLVEVQEVGCVSILKALSKNTSARVLKLKNIATIMESSRLEAALHEMLRENKSLRSLAFENKTSSGRSKPTLLPASIVQKSLHIEELSIDRCTLDEKAAHTLAQIAKQSHNLNSLRLSEVIWREGSLREIAGALAMIPKGGLDSLEMSSTDISEQDWSLLLESIAVNKTLISVSLDNTNLGLKQAPKLAAILRNNEQLKSLSLGENNLNGKAIQVMVKGLSKNSSLQCLSLAFNPVGDDGAAYLAACLTEQHTLQRLDLAHAEIWHPGCVVLAKSLSTMVGLNWMGMDGNDMDQCAEEMLASVTANKTITHLTGASILAYDDNSSNNSSKQAKQWKQVEYNLRLNRANRRLLTVKPSLALWSHVLEHSNNDVDVLYFMLTQNPDILQPSVG